MSANIRKTALMLLRSYESEDRYVNLLTSSPRLSGLSREERSSVTALLYTAVENKLRYDYLICALSKRSIDDIDPYVRDVLRIGLCQILDMSALPDFASVNETVSLGRHKGERGFINAVLRGAANVKNNLPFPPKEKNLLRYLGIYYSVPLPTVKLIASILGEEGCESFLEASGARRALSLTVNERKVSRDELLCRLDSYGATEGRLSDSSITLNNPVSPTLLPGFAEGEFFVQDEAGAISTAALGAMEGEVIIDTCAAPGGKSFGAAIRVGDSGRVYSFDLHESKLSLIKDGAGRLGLNNITVMQNDATTPRAELFGKADRVICDVPCSGLGVISKKPDLRYKDFSSDGSLPALQYTILERSAEYLKAGGVLLYSTCTICPEENEGVTDRFIREHPEFSYEDFKIEKMGFRGPHITLLPHKHGTDGFYIARLRKAAKNG